MNEEFSPQLFEMFRRSIADYCGICLTEEQRRDFEKNVRLRMATLGLESPLHYLNILTHGQVREWDELIPLIANNETFFFREPFHFEILRNRILPELLKQRRVIRIWSAGCSTGEEVYSLAITLLEAQQRYGEFEAYVIGTDIDQAALETARRSEYGRNSFRGVSTDLMRKYFLALDEDPIRYAVDARVKGLTQFTYLNLLQSSYGSEFAHFDVVFFRNVSIYFSKETIERVHRNLMKTLRDGGYLFVAASETLHHNLGSRLIEMDNAFFYQKAKSQNGAQPISKIRRALSFLTRKPSVPDSPKPMEEIVRAYRDGRYDDVLGVPLSAYRDADRMTLLILKTLVRMGQEQWPDAERGIVEILQHDEVNAEAYLLRGLIEMYRANREAAENAFRKALFLNTDLSMAHFYLGKLLQEIGKTEEAQREFRNTIRSLERSEDRSITFQALGHSADTIRNVCKQLLSS